MISNINETMFILTNAECRNENGHLKKNLEDVEFVTSIKFTFFGLNKIPDFNDFINLKELDLSNNKITKIEGINNLNLKLLNLSNNQINEIIDLNKNLEFLNISFNNLKNLKNFKDLRNLKELRLNNNKIKILPDFIIKNNKSLKILNLSNNLLKNFLVLNSSYIEELNLSNNLLNTPKLYKLKRLKKIKLNNNKIKKIPKFSETIEYIDLSNNEITIINNLDNILHKINYISLENNLLKYSKYSSEELFMVKTTEFIDKKYLNNIYKEYQDKIKFKINNMQKIRRKKLNLFREKKMKEIFKNKFKNLDKDLNLGY